MEESYIIVWIITQFECYNHIMSQYKFKYTTRRNGRNIIQFYRVSEKIKWNSVHNAVVAIVWPSSVVGLWPTYIRLRFFANKRSHKLALYGHAILPHIHIFYYVSLSYAVIFFSFWSIAKRLINILILN